MNAPNAPRTGKSDVERPGRIDFSFLLTSWFQRGVLAVLVSCLVAFLTIEYVSPPSLDVQVGDIAKRDVRATQSIDIPDPVATEERRDQAVRNVRAVFDYNAEAKNQALERIRVAFELGRANLRSGKGTGTDTGEKTAPGTVGKQGIVEKSPAVASQNGGPGPAGGSDASFGLPEPAASDSREIEDARREFLDKLGIEIVDVFYESLQFMKFSRELQNVLEETVSRVLRYYIVLDMENLPSDLSSRGIMVMRLTESRRDELLVKDASLIIDLSKAHEIAQDSVGEMLADSPQFHRDTALAVVLPMIQPNLTYNSLLTNLNKSRAHRNTPPATHRIRKGEMIVRAGDPIDEQKLEILNGIAQVREAYQADRMFASMALLTLLFLTGLYVFASKYVRKFSTSVRDLVIMGIILVFVIALARVSVAISNGLSTYLPSIPLSCYYYAIPLACGAMLVRILMNSETALVFAIMSSSLASMLLENNVFYLAFFFLSGLAAAGGIAHTKERVHVLRGGLIAACVNVTVVLAIHLVQSSSIAAGTEGGGGHLVYNLIFAFVGGIGAAVLTLGVVPFFEMFGYVTDYKLLELANLDHPLLKEVMLHAPGTYHHSVIVGSLSEAAAQEVGCNALLARVACYYHDVGKVRKPDYFIENLRSVTENQHDRLEPHLSARIISSHIRDGIALARQHHLPQPIIDLIPQHHGTSLIGFFYNKAKEAAGDRQTVLEKDFRYPGPKPQSREAAIVMLADATEASTRSLKQFSASKIRENLRRIFQRVLADGQLDECPLTLKDLNTISETFLKVLLGIYHNRVEYPAEYLGANVPGEGTGAVITLDTESVSRAASVTGELIGTTTQERQAPGTVTSELRRSWPGDAWATTSSDNLRSLESVKTGETDLQNPESDRPERTDDPPSGS